MTVEASFIFSFVCLILLAFLYFGFWFMEEARIQTTMGQMLEGVSTTFHNDGNLSTGQFFIEHMNQHNLYAATINQYDTKLSKINTRIKKELQQSKMIFEISSVKTSLCGDQLSCKVNAVWKIPIFSYFNVKGKNIIWSRIVKIQNEEEFARRLEIIEKSD